MTQENKELLLKDLCARLPYGVKVLFENKVFSIDYISAVYEEIKLDIPDNYTLDISNIKPYLFPLSSMTDEQYDQLYIDSRVKEDSIDIIDALANDMDAIDWLNKNHFDYRGLIEKGLAIDATNLNIY